MTKITVLGGTGYTGANIVHEAANRGHEVVSFSRAAPQDAVPGVRYETGSLLDDSVGERAVTGADVVIAALSPRGDLEAELSTVYSRLAELAAASGTRLGVIGGYGSLRLSEGAPRIAYGNDVHPDYAAESRVMAQIVDELVESAPHDLDWFYVSPGASYGAAAPGEATGAFRIGGDVALFDDAGRSAISGLDFATAVLDEVDTPAHHRAQFSVAY